MSVRAVRWVLWLVALAAAPVPSFGLASGRIPPLHQLELGALALAFSLSERAQGVGPLISALFLAQALAWSAALWLAAWLLARAAGRLPPLTRTRACVLGVLFGLGFASVEPLYRTPYSAHAARSTLFGVYR